MNIIHEYNFKNSYNCTCPSCHRRSSTRLWDTATKQEYGDNVKSIESSKYGTIHVCYYCKSAITISEILKYNNTLKQ